MYNNFNLNDKFCFSFGSSNKYYANFSKYFAYKLYSITVLLCSTNRLLIWHYVSTFYFLRNKLYIWTVVETNVSLLSVSYIYFVHVICGFERYSESWWSQRISRNPPKMIIWFILETVFKFWVYINRVWFVFIIQRTQEFVEVLNPAKPFHNSLYLSGYFWIELMHIEML